MRSFMGAAGRVSLSILLALALCPALSLEAFAGEEPARGEAAQEETAVQTDPNPMNQDAASSTEDESASPKADSPNSQQPIADPAEPSSVSEPTLAASAISMAEEDLDWQPCGTCEWAIDSSNTLIVRPANGAEPGRLDDWVTDSSPWAGSAIVAARFEELVSAPTCYAMFRNCSSLETIDFAGLDVSGAADASYMFAGCDSLKSLDLSDLDLQNVSSKSYMFVSCKFGEITLGSHFGSTESVELAGSGEYWLSSVDGIGYEGQNLPIGEAATYTNIPSGKRNQVYRCGTCEWVIDDNRALTVRPANGQGSGELDYYESPWAKMQIVSASFEGNVKAHTTRGMFYACSSLESVDLSGLDTSEVKSMGDMFFGCSSLQSLDLFTLDTSSVTDYRSMFYGCSSLSTLDVSNFDTSRAMDMALMFFDCSSLKALDISSFDTSNVKEMFNMFSGCSSLEQFDASYLDVSTATSLSGLFYDCSSLESLDVTGFDTSNISDMYSMFAGCSSLISLDMSQFDTSRVSNFSNMFGGCSSLTSLDISRFDMWQAYDVSGMFSDCSALRSLNLKGFEGSSPVFMNALFSGCSSLEAIDLSSLDTSSAQFLDSMFERCSSLISLDLSNLDTSKATSLSWMFSDCASLKSVDLSSFDTSSVQAFNSMFAGCSSLEHLDLSNFNTMKAASLESMFSGCPSLTLLDLSSFDTTNAENMDDMFGYSCSDSLAITIGDKFSFPPSSRCSFPIVEASYPDRWYDGSWIDIDTGVIYAHDEIPSNRMATYIPAAIYYLVGEMSIIGDPCPGTSLKASVSLTDACAQFNPELSYQWFEKETWQPVSESSSSPVFDVSEELKGKSLYCIVSADSPRVQGSLRSDYVTASHTPSKDWITDGSGHWYACTDCGAKQESSEHLFDTWTLAKPATCTSEGKESRTCAVCGYRDVRTVAALGHAASQEWNSSTSEHWRTCLECSTVLNKAAHAFSAWEMEDAATCFDAGTETHTCSVCGYKESRTVPATGHSFSDAWVSDADGHWQVCSICEAKRPAAAHDFNEWTETKPATCTETGKEGRTCSVCHLQEERDIPASGHSTGAEWTSDPSGHWKTCSACGVRLHAEKHSFDDWTTVQDPTANATGTKERACSACGYTEQEEIPSLESSNPFEEVEESTPHYGDVLWLAYKGITTGWVEEDGTATFRPLSNVARADMAAFLYRLAGSPAYEPSAADLAAFSDVNGSTPHYKEVLWLASAGISEGWDVGDGKREFRPYESIARSDMAAFLHRLAIWMGAPDPGSEGRTFSDVGASIAHAEDVAWLAAAGITTGFPDGTFRPYDSIVRCDMAAFLHRLDGFVGGYEVD